MITLMNLYTFTRQLQELKRLYVFREPEEVEKFLSEHMFLAPLVMEAYWVIKTYFPASDVFLEINIDPENTLHRG